jgi:hypothetical protein
MLIELIAASLIIAFLCVAALGHVFLAVAIYKCLHEDYDWRGRRPPAHTTPAANIDSERPADAFIETARVRET